MDGMDSMDGGRQVLSSIVSILSIVLQVAGCHGIWRCRSQAHSYQRVSDYDDVSVSGWEPLLPWPENSACPPCPPCPPCLPCQSMTGCLAK
ncbi:MAG: hypothetical protein ACOX9E_05830 [Lentisphaeria bacterium]